MPNIGCMLFIPLPCFHALNRGPVLNAKFTHLPMITIQYFPMLHCSPYSPKLYIKDFLMLPCSQCRTFKDSILSKKDSPILLFIQDTPIILLSHTLHRRLSIAPMESLSLHASLSYSFMLFIQDSPKLPCSSNKTLPFYPYRTLPCFNASHTGFS